MDSVCVHASVRRVLGFASCLLACASSLSLAHALEAPSYGLQAGQGLLPPEVIADTRFYDPFVAEQLNAQLASAAAAYNACQPQYSDLAGNLVRALEGERERLDSELQTGGAPGSESERLGEILAGDDQRMAHDYEALAAILDALPRALPQPCPPGSAVVRLGSYWSVLDSLHISNGGFDGEREITVIGGDIGTTIETESGPIALQFRFGIGDIDDQPGDIGVDPVPRIFYQFDGGTQFIPAGLNVTNVDLNIDYLALGGSISFDLNDWLGNTQSYDRQAAQTVRFSPDLHLGFTHIGHEGQLRIDYGDIDFLIDERREVDTSRLNLGLDLDLRLNLTPSVNFIFTAVADANLDFAHGEGSYHTAQTGNFDETVGLEKSKTALTGSLGAEGGFRFHVNESVKLDITGYGKRVPIWTLEPREGAEARLDHDMQTVLGVSARIRTAW